MFLLEEWVFSHIDVQVHNLTIVVVQIDLIVIEVVVLGVIITTVILAIEALEA